MDEPGREAGREGEREGEPDHEPDEDQRLRSAALQNAVAILAARQRDEQELRRTKEALEEETRVLELLNRTGALLASKLDLPSLAQAVADAAVELSGAQRGVFFCTRADASGGPLHAASGASRDAADELALFAPAFEVRTAIRSGDLGADPRYARMVPPRGGQSSPVRSYLAVPIVGPSGEMIGGVRVGHREPDVFTERTERLLLAVAAQAAIAIDNARLYEEARAAADAERAARSELERIGVLKDQFLATLSHELRTPLNAIMGWAQILQAMSGLGPEVQQGLDTIYHSGRAQLQMIEDLLDMNRIVSGRLRLDIHPVDLPAVLERAVEAVLPSIEAKGHRLSKAIDPLAGPIQGDAHRLQQVVWNLLSNAVKFTPKGGKIELLLRRARSHVEIVVTDSGIGIRAEFLPYVFDRFRQQDSSTTRRYGGLGIGLSIVKQLVELHGGTVRAVSGGEQQGSTFVVSLPLSTSQGDDAPVPAGAARKPAWAAGAALAGVKVLVVDDATDSRELVRMVLAGASAEVVTAASADEALALLDTTRPDVIVSDIGMPDRDGYQLMRAVRRLPAERGGKTPAVAMTAFARSEDRMRAMLAGFQVHVAKPIEPYELIVIVASLVGRMQPSDGA
jgi:signal transduction histidine kinase/ActR/RegA family two-component response regulator